jgi:hypothetical protein
VHTASATKLYGKERKLDMTQALNHPALLSGHSKAYFREQLVRTPGHAFVRKSNPPRLLGMVGSFLRGAILLPFLILGLLLMVNGLLPVFFLALCIFLPILLPVLALALGVLGHRPGPDNSPPS